MFERLCKLEPEKGSILLDCLMAMVIFALAGTMILQTYGMLTRNSSFLRQETDAKYLALQEVESLRQLDQKGVVRTDSSTWATYIASNSGLKTLNGRNYNVTIVLIPSSQLPTSFTSSSGKGTGMTAISADTNLTPVRVTVAWTENTAARSIVMETYLMK
jgi:type II secretory pathway pseudopilin PulG